MASAAARRNCGRSGSWRRQSTGHLCAGAKHVARAPHRRHLRRQRGVTCAQAPGTSCARACACATAAVIYGGSGLCLQVGGAGTRKSQVRGAGKQQLPLPVPSRPGLHAASRGAPWELAVRRLVPLQVWGFAPGLRWGAGLVGPGSSFGVHLRASIPLTPGFSPTCTPGCFPGPLRPCQLAPWSPSRCWRDRRRYLGAPPTHPRIVGCRGVPLQDAVRCVMLCLLGG